MKIFQSANRFLKVALPLAITILLAANLPKPLTRTIMAISGPVEFGVYWDKKCTAKVQSIDWGKLALGSSKSVDIYVRNEGDVALSLSLNIMDWMPSEASRYLSLSWNYQGQILKPGDVLPLTFRLWVSSTARGIGAFSFNIVISSLEKLLEVKISLEPTLDQEGIVVTVLLESSEILKGGVGGYRLELEISDNVTILSVLPGDSPFNSPPTVERMDNKLILSAYLQETQGLQMSNLILTRLRLRFDGTAGVEQILKPSSLIIVDALSRKEHNTVLRGEALKFMRGDADNDGKISITDAIVIAEYLAGVRPEEDLNMFNAASVNHDGDAGDKVTIADAMVIAQYLDGQRDEYFRLKGE